MLAKYSGNKQMIGLALFVGSVGFRHVLMRGGALDAFQSTLPKAAFSTVTEASESPKRRKKSPIYTRTGDGGTSSLYNGERRPKDDLIFDTIGTQDELNSAVGIAREFCILANNGLDEKLTIIQSRLFDLGAAVATPVNSSSEEKLKYTKFDPEFTDTLEQWIDELDSQIQPIRFFILPSGGLSATHLNLARSICRRAERSTVPLIGAGITDKEVGRYLNRLSDFLFVAARYATFREGRTETPWKKA